MGYVRNLLFGCGVFGVGSIGYYAFWVKQKSLQVSKDQRGDLFIRMKEVTFAFSKTKQIEDRYTADNHVRSVATLSSIETTMNDKLKKEIDKIRTYYYAGYLQEVFQDHPSMSDPVFDYNEDLPVALPTFPGQTHKGFVFSGPLNRLHHLKSREDILNGNYIRCKSLLFVINSEKGQKKYKKIDALITGTNDCRKCYELKNMIFRDAVMLASGFLKNKKLDNEDPISDTPVFDCNEKECDEVGDLITLPESVKVKMRSGNFIACNFYGLKKTRLSQVDYKECGAIIVGTTNEAACEALHFEFMRKTIEDGKKQRR